VFGGASSETIWLIVAGMGISDAMVSVAHERGSSLTIDCTGSSPNHQLSQSANVDLWQDEEAVLGDVVHNRIGDCVDRSLRCVCLSVCLLCMCTDRVVIQPLCASCS
jgi:hypothetical protein